MISPDNIFGLLAVLLALAAFAAGVEQTPLGKRISGAGIVILSALAASHFNIIPRSAPVYGVIWSYLVPVAIALFLFRADLIKVFAEGGRVLIAFLIGMAGSVLGALLAAPFVDLGANEAKIAAVFSATYTGGSLNFVAVADALRFEDASQLSAALAIDNILGVGFIIFLNVLAGWRLLQNRFHWRVDSIWGDAIVSENAEARAPTLFQLLTALAIAVSVTAASEKIAGALGIPDYSLLVLTVLMTAAATIGRSFLARLRGEDVIAMIFMYLFFAIVGAGADVNGILSAAPGMFWMVLLIFAVHLMFLAAAGALFKLNYAELIVASLACIAGPPVAAAIAILFKWRNLVLPGILTGILGYVLGNFVGIGVYSLLEGANP
ncbi:DUF819 domain-containing protein [Hyphococcus sp.]|jgi:uncharacterized membrane protein|uniref:DUF819 family protein n=1 Tax=Hyphococcus sp. TaxID=2038636 RepID=UPI003D12911E